MAFNEKYTGPFFSFDGLVWCLLDLKFAGQKQLDQGEP
jgi:hypothetical protein